MKIPGKLTDSTGGAASATALAAFTNFTPSVAWNGSSIYPSAADATAIAAAFTVLVNAVASLSAQVNALTDVVRSMAK